MIGEKYIQKLVRKAAASSLNNFTTQLWNAVPVSPFDHLSKAIWGGYAKSDMIYSIINKKAVTGSRPDWGVYKVKSLSAFKEYKDYMSRKDITLKEALMLKESAIEPVKHQLNEKFQNPNATQSGSEYTQSQLTYLNCTGNAFELSDMEGKRLTSLNILPADKTEILVQTGVVPIALAYQINWGLYEKFDPEQIIHAKYNNPRWSYDGRHLYGMSPMEVIWNLIQAEEEANDALAEQMKNRGPRKIIGIDNDKITEETAAQSMMEGLKNTFNERSRDFKDKTMPVWGRIQVEDMGLTASELNMTDRSNATFQRFCNVFNVPWQWFSTSNESKYSNLEIYTKQAILNGVIPDLNLLRSARNRYFKMMGLLSVNEVIDYDISAFSELNVDRGAMWEYLKDMPLKEADKLKEMGFDNYDDIPELNQVLVNRNRIPIQNINEINHVKTGQTNAGTSQEAGGEGQS